MLVVVRTSCASCWGYNLLFVSAKVTVRGRVDGSACSQVWDVWLMHTCYQFAAHVVSQHVWAGGMGMGMGNGMGHWQWPGVLLIVVSHWTWALAMLGAWGWGACVRIASLHIVMHCFGGSQLPHHFQSSTCALINDDDQVVL